MVSNDFTSGVAGLSGRRAGRGSGTDLGVIVGLAAGAAVLLTAIGLGRSPGAFLDVPSLLIVFGGTIAAVTICFPTREVRATAAAIVDTLTKPAPDPTAAALRAVELADEARRNGLLQLERVAERETRSPYLRKALSLIADGVGETELEQVLRFDVQATQHRLRRSAAVLRRAADFAPAMGLIGTLIGLVQMLGQLSEPRAIGPAMAVALLTTFYGAVLANMVLSPLAVKLERNANDEELECLVLLRGAISISRKENPRRLALLLNSVLGPRGVVPHVD